MALLKKKEKEEKEDFQGHVEKQGLEMMVAVSDNGQDGGGCFSHLLPVGT